MKYLLILLTILFCVGCYDSPDEVITYRKIIPDSLREASTDLVIELIAQNQVTTREDDEEWSDFLTTANDVAIDRYGLLTIGITDRTNHTMFVPYDRCSERQKLWIDRYLKEPR